MAQAAQLEDSNYHDVPHEIHSNRETRKWSRLWCGGPNNILYIACFVAIFGLVYTAVTTIQDTETTILTESIDIDGTKYEQTSVIKNQTRSINDESIETQEYIKETDDSYYDDLTQHSNYSSISRYDAKAMSQYMSSQVTPEKLKIWKKHYNEVGVKLFSKDRYNAAKRKTVQSKKTALCSRDKVSKIIDILGNGIERETGIELTSEMRGRLTTVSEMAAAEVDAYSDDYVMVDLSTEYGGVSKHAAGLIVVRLDKETDKISLGMMIHSETWTLKKNWKINGECKRDGKECWDNVKLQNYVKYQLYSDFVLQP